MTQCPYCKGELMKLETTRILELAVLKVSRVYICKRCRRTRTITETYLHVRVPLNAEVSVQKGGGL